MKLSAEGLFCWNVLISTWLYDIERVISICSPAMLHTIVIESPFTTEKFRMRIGEGACGHLLFGSASRGDRWWWWRWEMWAILIVVNEANDALGADPHVMVLFLGFCGCQLGRWIIFAPISVASTPSATPWNVSKSSTIAVVVASIQMPSTSIQSVPSADLVPDC